MFPPHARGWTRSLRPDDLSDPVSPARAGMDPTGAGRTYIPSGFPRTRGDGPLDPVEAAAAGEFPPHARGWTRGIGLQDRDVRVSPARAGMDPASRRPCARR